ncbi:MAG: hypothetical protein M3Z25_04120 [Actinomycetota bacterium]|nr:hypothetical protein [Actinomycetota bacterium]
MLPSVEIADSARKHGVPDVDIRHAVTHPIRVREDNDRALVLGTDRAGRFVELVVLLATDDEPAVVIHAMRPARPKFLDLLR